MSFLASVGLGLAGGIIGAIGGNKASKKKFRNPYSKENFGRLDGMDANLEKFKNQLMDPNRGLEDFRQLAKDAAPSRSDFLATAAATGGSQRAAGIQGRQAGLDASRMATQNFGTYRRGLDSLATNVMGQRTQLQGIRSQYATNAANLQFQDFSQRRQAKVSMWNNFAQMGFGLAGNALGQKQMTNFIENAGQAGNFMNQGVPSLNQTKNALGGLSQNQQNINFLTGSSLRP